MKKLFLLIIISGVVYYFYNKNKSADNDLPEDEIAQTDSEPKREELVKEIKKQNTTLENVTPVTDPKKLEAYQNQWNNFQASALANTQPLEMNQSNNVIIQSAEQYSDEQLAEEAIKTLKENQEREETEQIP